ncbi:xanthine dehydrogenase family protein molybdopterin-binding subunit [Clostridium sp.]|uniref:xanthine dehydrogenase family protein molybdopterin-binding subunit n=1 Tax=Clostridium sp. TaxID=1506 RepID=UPI0034649751
MIGENIKKIDAMSITTGKPVYTDDLAMKDALVVKLLRSPHSFAKILDIDIERALKVPGVECILTYKDVPKERFTLAGQSYPEPSPYDRLILDEIVRYVGDEVAIIAAKDERTALKAMDLIKVKYEVYEPVLDFETAEGHSSIVHEEEVKCNFNIGMEKEKNIASKEYVEHGNVEEELKKCDYVVEETYYTQAQAHCMMETYRAFNYMDHMGRLVVVSSTQIPFHVKRHLSRALQIPGSKIRVIKPRIGGGFGGKQTACVEIFTAIVTLKTGKPAKLVYDRKETFQCSTSRHGMRFKVRLGADKEGYIKAIDIEGLSDTGAYGEHCSTVFGVVGEKTIPLYNKINAGRYHGKVVYTNKVPAGAFRGYGATQGCFAIECAVNELAEKLNMDPIEIRFKNLCKEGEMTYPYNKVMTSSTLHKCIEKGKELIKWDEKYPCVDIGDNKVRSVGMAVTMQGSGIAGIDTSSSEIRLSDSGEYILFIGSTDMGTGSDTILAQMAAEVLETTVDNIVVVSSDTDVTPYDPGSYASSTTYVTGMAVIKAAENLKSKIISKAAEVLEVSIEDIDFIGDKVITKDGKTMYLKNLAEILTVGPRTEHLTGIGSHGSEVSPPPFIAGFVEIELDKETGKIDIIDYVAVVDCGTVINPNLARVQVEGGIVQGIGLALYEEVHYNPKGKLDTNTFMQYKIPNRKDVGNIIVDFVPSFEKTGPFGAKSVGEVVVNTPSPAIAHAVYNGAKINIRNLPITGEKVFMAMLNK